MIFYIIIGSLFAFLLGYCMGKQQGWKSGYREAEVLMPLKLRQDSLEAGKCVICDENWVKASQCEIFSRDVDTL